MERTSINTLPLKGRIREYYGTQENFAKKVGLSLTAVNNILNGKSDLSRDQIIKWADLLDIDLSSTELNRVFFSPKTCENTKGGNS